MIRILTVFIAVILSPLAGADEIQATIEEAGNAYKKGNYQLSLDRLEQAMNLVKDVQAAKIINYFPEPLDGWQIADPKKDDAAPIPNVQLGMFSSVLRRYKKEPEAGVSINLLADDDAKKSKKDKSPWVQFTLMQKPNSLIKMGFQGVHAIRANDPNSTSVSLAGYSGILHCNPKKPTCDAFFDFDGAFLLMVNAENTSKEDFEKYVKAFDAEGLLSAE